jgi:hypothetical protein
MRSEPREKEEKRREKEREGIDIQTVSQTQR